MDGDLISLGSVCEILVGLQGADLQERGSPRQPLQPLQNDPRQSIPQRDELRQSIPRRSERRPFSLVKPVKNGGAVRLSPQAIALISIAAIVLVAALAVLALQFRGGSDDRYQASSGDFEAPPVTPVPVRPCEGLTAAEVEEAAQRVVGRICNDPNSYDFPSDKTHITRIKEVIERHCQSPALSAALQRLGQARPQLLEWSGNQIATDLLAYAALAETDGGASDTLAAARRMAPRLIGVSKLLKDSNADSALLSLAAYKMGDPASGTHPIHSRMEGRINHDTERNVWDLYRKGGLAESEYDFVIRVLAFGIMAHEPRRFGVE
jgi:hypothetical protein